MQTCHKYIAWRNDQIIIFSRLTKKVIKYIYNYTKSNTCSQTILCSQNKIMQYE